MRSIQFVEPLQINNPHPSMSKFFVQGNVSDNEDSDNSDNDQKNIKNQPSYTYDILDDDRNNNEKRVVQTEKQKKWAAMRDLSNKVGTALNNKDYEKVWHVIQDLLKIIEKEQKLIQKEGHPPFFLRLIHRINEEVNTITPEDKKKMKKHSSTAFNIMKQKLKNKIWPELETLIKELLEKGEENEVSEEESEEPEEDEEESEQEEEEDLKKLLLSTDQFQRRKYWLKRVDKKVKGDEEEEDTKKPEDTKKAVDVEQISKNKIKKVVKIPKDIKKTQEEIKSVKDAELRMKGIIKDFAKLNSQEQREQYLQNLNQIAEKSLKYKDFERLSFLLVDIPIRIEVSRQMKLTHFDRKQYLLIFKNILQIYEIMSESVEENLIDNVIVFDETDKNKEDKTLKATDESIFLSLKTYGVLLLNELKKAFMFIDNSALEYSERLQDLIKLTDLMYKLSRDLSVKENQEKQAAQISFKVLENTYFMSADFLKKIGTDSTEPISFIELASEQKLTDYANNILKELRKQEDVVTKTVLFLAYNHSLNGRERGKELLIMSNIPEQISSKDYLTQALYNRVMVQIGLNAFRNGNFLEVQQFLSELCGYGKTRDQNRQVIREFLAQGYSRTQAEKQIPKNKILPYYLYLNVDVIESVELIASMIIEVPYTLMEGGRITSKTYKKVFYEYERSHFIAEPLNSRDLIYASSNELRQGNWKQCYERLMELEIWDHLSNPDSTKSNLLKVIKQQSLKCYLIGNRKCFRSISLSGLASKFDLDLKQIRRLACKMIQERSIHGSITSSGFLNFIQKKQTEMQKICEGLFVKLKDMMEANELQFTQRVNTNNAEEEEEGDKEEKLQRRIPIAMNQKLKSILSKRQEKN